MCRAIRSERAERGAHERRSSTLHAPFGARGGRFASVDRSRGCARAMRHRPRPQKPSQVVDDSQVSIPPSLQFRYRLHDQSVMLDTAVPVEITDPINARILAVSEDRISGFLVDPFAEIARVSDVDVDTVHERLRAMLAAGTIRRIRQTLMATNLAPGALIAWRISNDRLDAGFDFLWKQDPFSGHIVIRSTDAETPGSAYRLWTTLKVPQGFSMKKHCDFLAARIGAEGYRMMPAKRLFALGVGHVRRRGIEPGSKTDELGQVIDTNVVELSDLEWRVLEPLKREFAVDEIHEEPWASRAAEAGIPLDEFVHVAASLNERGVIGRFSTFLE